MAKPTLNPLTDIVIIQAGGETSGQVLQGLRDKRFVARTVVGFATAESAIAKFAEPIVIVEAGTKLANVEQAITNLQTIAQNRAFPLILIGDGSEAHERTLDTLFPAATTLNLPYGLVEILAAINYVTRTYRQRMQAQQTAAARPTATTKESKPEAIRPEHQVPHAVFDQLLKLDLVGKLIGGAPFSSGDIDDGFLERNQMLPTSAVTHDAIRQVCVDAGKWGRTHLARVSFCAQRLIAPMKPEPRLVEALKASSILFAATFAGDKAELLKRQYADTRSQALRLELCSRVKDSAFEVMQKFQLEPESRIISILARLIAAEQQPTDDDASVVASAIMAADMTSRACYESGSWNPRRAYTFFNKLKQGAVFNLHPAVMCCLVKFLAEAIASHTPIFLLPKELRRNKSLQLELMNQARAPIQAHEERVPVFNLAPGMTLSRPLVSMDGSEVLANDVRLDQDLIWRIWQLSAMKPLRSAIIRAPNVTDD